MTVTPADLGQFYQAVRELGFPVVIGLLFWYTVDRTSKVQLQLLRDHMMQETAILNEILNKITAIEVRLGLGGHVKRERGD